MNISCTCPSSPSVLLCPSNRSLHLPICASEHLHFKKSFPYPSPVPLSFTGFVHKPLSRFSVLDHTIPPLSPSPSSTLRPSPGHTLAAFLPLSPPYACPLSLPHLYVLQQIMYLPDCPPPTFLSFNRSLTSLPVPLLPLCSSAGNTLFPPSSVSHPSVLHNICLQ